MAKRMPNAANVVSRWSTPCRPWNLMCCIRHSTLTFLRPPTDYGSQQRLAAASWRPVLLTSTFWRRSPRCYHRGWHSTCAHSFSSKWKIRAFKCRMSLARQRFPARPASATGSTVINPLSTRLSTSGKPTTSLSFTWRRPKRCQDLKSLTWRESWESLMTLLRTKCRERLQRRTLSLSPTASSLKRWCLFVSASSSATGRRTRCRSVSEMRS